MLSIGRIGSSHRGQCDGGETTDCPRGIRYATTFRNEPMMSPKTARPATRKGTRVTLPGVYQAQATLGEGSNADASAAVHAENGLAALAWKVAPASERS